MEKNMCNCGGGMGMHYDHKLHVMKVLLKLLVLGLVFFFGFHLGEITGFIKASIGPGMMPRPNTFYATGMMQNSTVTPLPPPIPIKK